MKRDYKMSPIMLESIARKLYLFESCWITIDMNFRCGTIVSRGSAADIKKGSCDYGLVIES